MMWMSSGTGRTPARRHHIHVDSVTANTRSTAAPGGRCLRRQRVPVLLTQPSCRRCACGFECLLGRQRTKQSSFGCTDEGAAGITVQRLRGCRGAPGGKLKRECDDAPIHSPRSLALARLVQRPTMRMGPSTWLAMSRMREVTTSSAAPCRCRGQNAFSEQVACTMTALKKGAGPMAGDEPHARGHHLQRRAVPLQHTRVASGDGMTTD